MSFRTIDNPLAHDRELGMTTLISKLAYLSLRRRGTLLVISVTCQLLLIDPGIGHGQLLFDGAILDRANAWDAYPSILYEDGYFRMWWCSTSPTTGGDGIFLAQKAESLGAGGWEIVGEVINHLSSPLATNHTCDPSVVRGSFEFNSTQFPYALYYTYDQASGVDNSVAVAFSQDGVTWNHHTSPVLTPDGGFNGEYGAGASSCFWDRTVDQLHVYFADTTYGFGTLPQIRYKASTDGLLFDPTPSYPTSMVLGFTPENFGGSPDVAFSSATGQTYGVMSRLDAGENELLVVKTDGGLSDSAEWREIGRIGEELTGQPSSWEPGLARNSDSTLYIDRNGWGYVIFGAGEPPFGGGGGAFSWKLYQVRFQVITDPPLLSDSFESLGAIRRPGGQLAGTLTDLGQRTWEAGPTLVLSSPTGKATNSTPTGSHIGGVPFEPSEDPGHSPSIEALLDTRGSGWVAVGFSSTPTAGLFSGGGVWVLLHASLDLVEVFENGLNHLFSGPIPKRNADLNFARLSLDESLEHITVDVNGTDILSAASLTSVPTIHGAGIHVLSPESGGTTGTAGVLDFVVNGSAVFLFLDGFETSDLSRWSSSGSGERKYGAESSN